MKGLQWCLEGQEGLLKAPPGGRCHDQVYVIGSMEAGSCEGAGFHYSR